MNHESRIMNQGLNWLTRTVNSIIPYSLFLIRSITRYSLFIIPIVILCSLLIIPALAPPAHAADEVGPSAVRAKLRGAGGDLPAVPIHVIAGGIVRSALVLIGVVFFVLIIYGGSLLLAAGGNDEQVTKAKTIIVRSVIGLFIVIFAGAITQFITSYLARSAAPAPQDAPDDGVDRSAGSWCWWGISCEPETDD